MEPPKVDYIPLEEQPAWGNAWLAEMFCRWVRDDLKPPNTVKDNIRAAAMAFAAVESAHTGKIVDVHEFLRRALDAPESQVGGGSGATKDDTT